MSGKGGEKVLGFSFRPVVFAARGVVVDEANGREVAGVGTWVCIPHSDQRFPVELFRDKLTNLYARFNHLIVRTAGHPFQKRLDGSYIIFLLSQGVRGQFQSFALGVIVVSRGANLGQ
ncbi:MAG: hypothetical protein EWM72_00779 [Nitrospira sp.]|nr:MAG: hypothetical protein EWM72_00779 [Nitrospira sp.]